MNKFQGVTAIAAAALLIGGQAFATPINGSGANGESTLQDILDDIAVDGESFVDVNRDQLAPSAYWRVNGSGGSFSQVVIEIAGHADFNSFGIFDAADVGNRYELFSETDGAGDRAVFGMEVSGEIFDNLFDGTGVTFADNLFGFYLDTPDGVFYSAPDLNGDGEVHMVGFQGNDQELIQVGTTQAGEWSSNEFIFGWEDLPASKWDFDYNDFVVIMESINPVPEPSALVLFGLGLIGFGFAARRSRGLRVGTKPAV